MLIRKIDPKYSVAYDGDNELEIVNQAGVAIPDDEPVILFRARDNHAVEMLEFYLGICMADGWTRRFLKWIN